MSRLLSHAGALLCALAVAVVCLVLTKPTFYEFMGELAALGLLGFGLCVARTHRGGLVAASLAAAGLLMIVFAMPANAAPAHKAAPALSVIEAPVQPLALAAPTPPQQVVVSVAPPEAGDRSVSLPVADWTAAVRNTVMTLLLALWALAKNKLPAPVIWAIKLYGEQKLIDQAINLAINAVPGASKGAPLTVDVGSSVLAHALQWIVDEVPSFVVKLMGGEDGIKAKIFAALHLEPDASAAAMGVKATG